MAASIRFDQVGIAASSGPGARTDGVATGGRVTVRNDSGRPCRIELIGIPPDDTSVIGSIGQDSSDQYHFDPTAARYGSYLIRLIEGEGTLDQTIDEKVFGIRLPNSGLLIPAFNEKGDPLVTFADSIERKDKAATITHNNEAGPGGFKWLGWFKSLRELFIAVENGGGGGGGGAAPLSASFQISAPETGESEAVLSSYYYFNNDVGYDLSVGPDTELTRVSFPAANARYRITYHSSILGLSVGTHYSDVSVQADGGATTIFANSASAALVDGAGSVQYSISVIVDIPEGADDAFAMVHLPSGSDTAVVNGLLTIQLVGVVGELPVDAALSLTAQSLAGNPTGSTADAVPITISENQVAGRATGESVAGYNIQEFEAIDMTSGAGNLRGKILPQIYVAIASFATATNSANIDFPLPEDGYYEAMKLSFLLKRTTTGDMRKIAVVLDAKCVSGVASLEGAPEVLGGGNSIGVSPTVTVSGGSVRVVLANTTGESLSGRGRGGFFVEDLL